MTAPRLNQKVLTGLSQFDHAIRAPDVAPKIVHLGIGAFHRAHQAVFTDMANQIALADSDNNDEPWYILGVSLRSDSVQKQLRAQDGYYSVVETSAATSKVRIVGAVCDVIVGPQDPEALLAVLSAETTKVISLTVTEKGYCRDPASGNLNPEHPDIQHDLANLNTPKSAIGYLVSSLLRRYNQRNSDSTDIPTVLCCDNLPNNGSTLEKIVFQFASLVDKTFADWLKDNVLFPNTMVDRIVPATTDQDIAELSEQHGYQDLGMVKTEQFSQWVIEDRFSSARPAWEKAGAMLVDDVEPFEEAKLKLLNGTHSSLAYLGYLSGYSFVHEVMQDEDFVQFLKGMMLNEIVPVIAPPPGLDLVHYVEDLLTRFSNEALCHRTYQIAMDGSQKMPQRLLGTIEERLKRGESVERLCFAVAGWLRYTMAVDEKGNGITVQDPLAETLYYQYQEQPGDMDHIIEHYLSISQVFSRYLIESDAFKKAITLSLSAVMTGGVKHSMKALLTP